MASTPILFLGPVRAGKSTIASLVAARLGLLHVSLDDLRWEYYREIGYKDDFAAQVRSQGGFLALMFYRQLFDAYSLERVLSEHSDAVIDCGAGIGPFENQLQLEHIQSLCEPLSNIFLLLPSEVLADSLSILKARDPNPPVDLHFDINAHFLQHPGYWKLAKHIVFTKDKSPEETCSEVLGMLE